MPRAVLHDRSILQVIGDDAAALLQNVLTCNLSSVAEGRAAYGGLLTPQGKILADFLVHAVDGGFMLETHESLAQDLAKRLTLYRLRARAEIRLAEEVVVEAIWGETHSPSGAEADPRHPALGRRALVSANQAKDGGNPAAWNMVRIETAIPECGVDYEPGTLFPHEAGMASLGGVAFDKGCYVGQEVVSRMAHRGSVRRRVLVATGEGDWPPPGAELRAGERVIGQIGTSSNDAAIAIARLDRVREALEERVPMRAGAVEVRLALPAWADYDWPSADTAHA